jgi:3,4-dihydroxyphthalate decarboxylase
MSVDDPRTNLALSCRILAQHGLFKGSTGHVSARVAGHAEMLIRGRPEHDRGLLFAEPESVIAVDFNGKPCERTGRVRSVGEVYIHTSIYQQFPNVNAVVHAHPPAVTLCTISGVKIRPIYGAFDASGMRLALEPLPVYSRSITISTPELGAEMIEAMGDRDVCLLYGHGIAVGGRDIQDATHRAIALETLARFNWLAAQRFNVPDISDQDKAAWIEHDQASAARGGSERTDWLTYLGQLRAVDGQVDDTAMTFGFV